MKFKKDGKVYESTEAMLKANCGTTCMTECEIRTRCRKGESCVDYAYAYPAEVAQYLGRKLAHHCRDSRGKQRGRKAEAPNPWCVQSDG